MTSKILKTISAHNMISKGNRVCVGLSGGADSTALLHFLASNRENLGIKSLTAVHINHGIRGAEADRDMEFSKSLAESLNVEFLCFTADVPAEIKRTGESPEECARRIRYGFFEGCDCDKFATAHNLNDNMETFILNLARGSSLTGLCSIPYKRDKYIRPLLDCTRAEIEEYIKENELSFVTDSTNLSEDYTRNKIRHFIIPKLYEINPAFDKAFARCLDSVASAEDFVLSEAQKIVNSARFDGGYRLTDLSSRDKALKYRVISLILKEQNAKNINRTHLDGILKIIESNGKISVNGSLTASADRGVLSFNPAPHTEYFEIPVKLGENISTPLGILNFSVGFQKDLQKLNKEMVDNLIDCDKIKGNVLIRTRKNGDRYEPSGRKVTKTLKDLFNENKIPLSKRSRMLVLEDEKGIVWTEYFKTAQRCRVSEKTEKYIKISKTGVE